MAHVRKNYLVEPLTVYEKCKYNIDVAEFDIAECNEIEDLLGRNNAKNEGLF